MTGISVVVPTKDRLPYLQRAIPMFLACAEVGEVVVVVDGCRDETLAYVEALAASDSRVRFTDNVRNRGLPYSRNRGIDLASCEYVFTGEDDLELTAGFFQTLLAHMEASGADIISGRNIFRLETETAAEAISRTDDIAGEAIDRRTIAVHTGISARADQEQLLLPAPMLGRTSVFRKIRFDDGYAVNFWREESDFQLSARDCGYKLVYCPHAISFNFMITGDRGGAHAAVGVRRVTWVVRNNWRFIRKHRRLIAENFDIGNPYAYIASFAVRRIRSELVLPILVEAKRRMLANVRRSGPA
jgi:glycosyltransferase involved in cell wall biosynthesis